MSIKRTIAKILTITAVYLTFGNFTFAAPVQYSVPHQYPEKYTPQYIKQITPGYKDVGKDEVFTLPLIC